jgi:nitrite reductase/ring-hydroxylating ferredoxin subunit
MWTESLIAGIERVRSLDAVGKVLNQAVSKVVRPGRTKDLLAGTWLGHPVHPMLTDVPIGAWTSAFVLDLFGGRQVRRAADALVGVGVLAAVPTAATGLSDLADTEEPEERSLGTAHALANLTAVALYGGSWLARRRGRREVGVRLAMVGAAVMTGAGLIGGHLAYRKGIGVDQTVFRGRLQDWTPVLGEAELREAEPRRVRAGPTDILLYRREGRVFALADRCSHRGGPLHEGRVHDGQVTCPWHQSTFHLDGGAILQGPATAPQPCYDVRVRDGAVEVRERR